MDFQYFPDVRNGHDGFVGIIVGQKGSGKTSLLVDILKSVWKQKFNMIVIVSPTFALQDLSDEITDGRGIIVFSEFRPCIIRELEAFQIEKIEERKRILQNHLDGYCYEKIPEPHHVLLIFDDIGTLGKEGKLAAQMNNLSFIVRHRNISIIECAQRICLLSTGLGSQGDFYIFFAEQNPQERTNIQRRMGFGKRTIKSKNKNVEWFWNIFDRETDQLRSWIGIRTIGGRNFFFNQHGFLFD